MGVHAISQACGPDRIRPEPPKSQSLSTVYLFLLFKVEAESAHDFVRPGTTLDVPCAFHEAKAPTRDSETRVLEFE